MFENLEEESEGDVKVNPEVAADTCSCTGGGYTNFAAYFMRGP